MNLFALNQALGTAEIEMRNGTQFRVIGTEPWLTLDDLTAEQAAAYAAGLTNVEANKVRRERDRRLAECDWTQTVDAPVDQAVWAAYRQALRDVPQQPGFPETITWPEMPQ